MTKIISFDDLHSIKYSEEYTRSYDVRYIAEIKHLGLGNYRVLKDKDDDILEKKIEAQFSKWDETWRKKSDKDKTQASKEANISVAEDRTAEAQLIQEEIEDILNYTLKIDDTVNWDSLKDKKKFKLPNPKNHLKTESEKIIPPAEPSLRELPIEPDRNLYKPSLSIVDKVFGALKQKKIKQAETLYQSAYSAWQTGVQEAKDYNNVLKTQYEEKLRSVEQQKTNLVTRYESLEKDWLKEQETFINTQQEHNIKIENLRKSYFECNTESVIQYCEMVLNNSRYPDAFPKDFDLEYTDSNKTLIVEYVLPGPDDIPTLLEVKYNAAKKEIKEQHLTETQLAKIYDSTIYKILLRTLHEIFEADKANAIDAIIYNGWVNAINKATGKKVNNCIVSVQAKKTEFMEIELSQVDPKICFRNLKGIGSSKLSGIIAVAPIAQINKNDKRFVTSMDVAKQLNEGFNLAAMDWEEFEHLLREIFQKEFCINGGEVKVTQASRDGGVDAVAFDPDPIRGGKIVIQAKRYTNTVGVSAVRDLYGTVMNEGATKGILVTTANYGPDAYEFAKNKPLTLMNGGNLLHLIEKHGHKARIDLKEAKQILGERN